MRFFHPLKLLGRSLLAKAESIATSIFGAELFVLLVVAERRELIDFYLRRGYKETRNFRAYPVETGVGTPFNPNARLAVWHKSSNLIRCTDTHIQADTEF